MGERTQRINIWWNDVVKAAVERKEAAWKVSWVMGNVVSENIRGCVVFVWVYSS